MDTQRLPPSDPTPPGRCPGCEDAGALATPCPRPVCTRRGLHFVPPAELLGEAPDPLIGRLVDRYLIVRLLGAGGFGKVYLALQLPILMRAAVKILHRGGDEPASQRMADKFLAEARALALLTHPNIVRLLQFGAFEGSAFLAMELVDGATTLHALMRSREGRAAAAQDGTRHATRGRLTLPEVRAILGQLLDALEAAHAHDIVHRDIKPENIMLQSVPGHPLFVRVLDFGLAKFVSEQTATSAAIGTPVYMAPEQILQRHIGPWTDIYAVGALAFELLTGRRPYHGESIHEIFAKKLDGTLDPLAEADDLALPPAARAFFQKALAFEHTQRFQDVASCRAALADALAALGAEAEAAPLAPASQAPAPTIAPEPDPTLLPTLLPTTLAPRSTETVRRARTRRRWPLAVAGLALVALVVVLVLLLQPSGLATPLARRVQASTPIYVRVADVAHLPTLIARAPGLAQPAKLEQALEDWVDQRLSRVAEASGLAVPRLRDLLAHVGTLELAFGDPDDPLALVHPTDDDTIPRLMRELRGAREVEPSRWRVDAADLMVARTDDGVLVGRRGLVEAALLPPSRLLADEPRFKAALATASRDSAVFAYARPPDVGAAAGPFPRPAWFALAASASGQGSVDVELSPDAPLPDFLVRPARAKKLLAALPRGTLVAWSASFAGSRQIREGFERWVGTLPPSLAEALRARLDPAAPSTPGTLSTLGALGQTLVAFVPVASELVAGVVRDEQGHLAPLFVFDIEDEAAAKTLADRLADTATQAGLTWQTTTVRGAAVRFVDLAELFTKRGAPLPSEPPPFDPKLGFALRDGLFVAGGLGAIDAAFAAQAGDAPRLESELDLRGIDAANAVQLVARVGALAHGAPLAVPDLAELQATLARIFAPDANFAASLRLEAQHLRARTDAPVLALVAWFALVERPKPAPVPVAPVDPTPVIPSEPPPVDPVLAGTDLSEEQRQWPLESADATRFSLGTLPADKPLLVTFWAATCTPCTEQLPALALLAGRLGPGWQVVHIANEASWDPLRALAVGAPLFLRDTRGGEARTLATTFGTTQFPESYLFYRGRLLERFPNAQAWGDPELHARLLRRATEAGAPPAQASEADRQEAARWLVGGSPTFQDHFDRAQLGSDWLTDATGGWTIENGELHGTDRAGPLWFARALQDPMRIELTVSSPTGNLACWVGGDRTTKALGTVAAQGSAAGTTDLLGTGPGDPHASIAPSQFVPGQRYRWAIVRIGSRVYWTIDGGRLLIRDAPDGALGAGFGCGGSEMTIDDVAITPVP